MTHRSIPFRPLAALLRGLLGACLLGTAGCSLIIDDASDDDAGGLETPPEELDCFVNSAGACVLSSPGCSAEGRSQRGDVVCASCDGDDAAFEICGEARATPCTQQENALGEPCQRCVLDGEVLFDDCTDPAAARDEDLRCEQVERAALPEDPSQLEDPVPAEGGETCEVCTDEAGHVVRTRCLPEYDTCEQVEMDGRPCQRCTLEGELAFLDCEEVDLNPDVCEVYENEQGRCVDCYQQGTWLSHVCAPTGAGGQDLYCETWESFSGLFCTACYDDMGAVVESFCDEGPAAEYCEESFFEQAQQVCTTCLTAAGDVTYSECTSFDCLETGFAPGCATALPCTLRFEGDQLCRACPVLDGMGQPVDDVEVQCLSGGGQLTCEEYTEYVETPQPGPDPGAPDQPAPPVLEEITCLVCHDETGAVVYEACDGGGAAPLNPPSCHVEVNANGDECAVCIDPDTGFIIVDECSHTGGECREEEVNGELCLVCPGPTPGTVDVVECWSAQTCAAEGPLPLATANGTLALVDPATQEAFPALVDCAQCDTANDPTFAQCSLRMTCEGGPLDNASDPNNPGMGTPPPDGTDPGVAPTCPDAVTLSLAAPQCGAPWGDGDGGLLEAQRIMTWSLADLGVPLYGVSIVEVGPPEACAACSCSRGDVIEVTVAGQDAWVGALQQVGFAAAP